MESGFFQPVSYDFLDSILSNHMLLLPECVQTSIATVSCDAQAAYEWI